MRKTHVLSFPLPNGGVGKACVLISHAKKEPVNKLKRSPQCGPQDLVTRVHKDLIRFIPGRGFLPTTSLLLRETIKETDETARDPGPGSSWS